MPRKKKEDLPPDKAKPASQAGKTPKEVSSSSQVSEASSSKKPSTPQKQPRDYALSANQFQALEKISSAQPVSILNPKSWADIAEDEEVRTKNA